jgi:putative PLP-dependent aminotransferase (TIGR04422 family)
MTISETQVWMRPSRAGARRAPAAESPALARAVEEFYFRRVGARPLLFPSARAAISAALELRGVGRAHTVYAPKWSSHCVWEAIGRRANPLSEWRESLDAAIVVHKWGHVVSIPERGRPKLLIEDSVDSLITDARALFPNGGDFEVQSLSKLIGAYSGGLVYCRKAADRAALARLRARGDRPLSASQDSLKWKCVEAEAAHDSWHPWEWKNFRPSARGAAQVLARSELYLENAAACGRRARILERLFPCRRTPGRIPTVWPVPLRPGLPAWHFDTARSCARPRYERVGGLPLHRDIPERDFQAALRRI